MNFIKNPQVNQALRFGLYFAGIQILVHLLMDVTGLLLNQSLSFISMLVGFGAVLLFIYLYRKESCNDVISYGKAVGFGALMAVFSSIIFSIYYYIYLEYINPDFIAQMQLMMEEKMIEKGVPEEAIEQSNAMMARFRTPLIMFISNLFGGIFMGTLYAVIAAIFVKKAPKNPFEGITEQ